LLVEQNVLQSMEIADRAFVMENGDIKLSGVPSVLMDDPELQRCLSRDWRDENDTCTKDHRPRGGTRQRDALVRSSRRCRSGHDP
jgi:energy-coupling factor transporter ATP-binding protein EcfA2